MNNALVSFLHHYKHFTLPERELINAAFEVRAFKEGDHLFKGGKVCRELFFVCNGVLRIVIVNNKGVELTHFFVKEDQFCTILNSFTNEVIADEGIQAACYAEVLAISKARLFALYQQVPGLKEVIDKVMQQRLIDKIQTRNAYLGEDAETRYHLFMQQQPDIAMRVPLKDVAGYLGITPQSLSRIRKVKK